MKRTVFSKMAQDFFDGKTDAETFYNRFMDDWIANSSKPDDVRVPVPYIEQSLSLAVDSYCPVEFRNDMQPYDYDEEQLKRVVGIYLQTDDVDEAYRMMRRQGLI